MPSVRTSDIVQCNNELCEAASMSDSYAGLVRARRSVESFLGKMGYRLSATDELTVLNLHSLGFVSIASDFRRIVDDYCSKYLYWEDD